MCKESLSHFPFVNVCCAQLTAVAAFKALGQRGHSLHSLKLEQCGLTPASAGMIAHMLRDNNHISDVLLSHNPVSLCTS